MEAGTVLRGKYRIERTLGSGGMGLVYLATHVRLGQRVAIKMLHASALEKPEHVERFAREARAAATLTSDHVVRILDVDETEERVPFFVMEYLNGRDFEGVLKAEGRLPVARAVDAVLDACEALAEAHAVGIVHRDLKPANLFMTKRANGTEIVKVLDFGISKEMPRSDEAVALTTTQTVMGSPLYMSPEQLRASRDVDARTDVWSMGIVLYQMLTGSLPFTGTSATAVAACIAADEPRRARELRDDVPEALDAVVAKCLEKKASARYPSMLALAEALAPFASTPARIEAIARAAQTRSHDSDRTRAAVGTAPTLSARGRRTETLPELDTPSANPVPGASTESASVASVPLQKRAPRSKAPLAIAGVLAVLALGAAALRANRTITPIPNAPSSAVASATATASAQPEAPPTPVVTASLAPTTPTVAADAAPPLRPRPNRPTVAPSAAPASASPSQARDPLEVDIK